MHASLAFAAAGLATFAAAAPQAVTAAIAPQETIPAGCTENYPSAFQIQILNVTSGITKRQAQSTPLVSTLKDGVLTDAKGRTGYIASNQQFQYDAPAQAGAIYTAGFSVCENGSLALGNSAIFYKCLSGTFYNIYDEVSEEQCSPIYIQVLPVDGSSPTAAGAASQIADGQVTASPVTQIDDGQIQANTKIAAVTQIDDGQIQAPSAAANPVTQIGDGQVQAPTGAVVTQIGDGQVQAPNGTFATSTPAPFEGAASTISAGVLSLAGLLAILAL